MKLLFIFVFVALIFPGHLLAADDYESCIQEEKALQKVEKERCSGLSYLFNPSGCFTAQKALKAFNNGNCRDVIKSGKPVPATVLPPVPPAPPASVPAPPQAPTVEKVTEKEPEPDCDRLKAENARLKGAVERLKGEIERLGRK